jgi:transposase
MTNYREILRLHSQGISQRSIAKSCECSRNTVSSTILRAQVAEMSWPLPKSMSDEELRKTLFPEQFLPSERKMPDFEHIHKEMGRSGVTLSLLWDEYCQECRSSQEIPYMYTQFCKHYREYAVRTKATMHIKHKPGEKTEVDWAGQAATIIDNITGELITAYVFVAALPCSQYAYVEAFLSMNLESWINAHVNAFSYFGGATRIIAPDNLKTGVTKADWYTPVINKAYHEMAEHYGTAIIPCRVRAPKDKASVESTVGTISTWIIASLRNQQFFSLRELNLAICEKLDEFNNKPFQKKPGSRRSVFIEQEQPMLLPLPATPYELATWKVAIVQYNYCITVDKMHYSVPYEYIKHKVDVRLTKSVVEVFFNGNRIWSHPRLHGRPGLYSIIEEHMPEKHRQYAKWNGERFIEWAERIGTNTAIVVRAFLTTHKVEQQGYKSCMALLKLSDKFSVTRLEAACRKALTYTPKPSFKSVQTILKTGQDQVPPELAATIEDDILENFGFTRGSAYYGREK